MLSPKDKIHRTGISFCCCRIPTFGMSGGAQIEKCTMFLSGRRMAPAKDDTQVHGPCEG